MFLFIGDKKICVSRKKILVSLSFLCQIFNFLSFIPQKTSTSSMCCGENKGFEHVTYFTRKTKVSSYKVGAKSSIVTFVQGVIEFAVNENHRKTPE